MLLPRLSIFDPPSASEGSLDPLGLALLAGRLAAKLVPGFTERLRRPRFLSALCFGSWLLSRRDDGPYSVTKEGPRNVAFERLLLEAYARRGKRRDRGFFGIPGIQKARDAADANLRLARQLYLKSPEAVGLWVAYKGLATSLHLLDGDGYLLENGRRLLAAWEEGIGFPGCFLGGSAEGHELIRELEAAIGPLFAGEGAGRNPQAAWIFLEQRLRPQGLSDPERRVISELLRQDARRAEVFECAAVWCRGNSAFEESSEQEFWLGLTGTSDELQRWIATVQAYEEVAQELTDLFRAGLWIAAKQRGRFRASELRSDPELGARAAEAPERVRRSAPRALQHLAAIGFEEIGRASLGWIESSATSSLEALFDALIARHLEVQKQKPPDGKRPWLESGANGDIFVRTRFLAERAPAWEGWVHPYLSRPVRDFLIELGEVRSSHSETDENESDDDNEEER